MFNFSSLSLPADLKCDLDAQIGICVAHVLQQSIVLLADEGLLVVAGHVVPVDTVVVELVQQGQAVLGCAVLLELTVIGLGQTDAAGGGPIALGTLRGGCQLLQRGCPEPTVDVCGLQIGTLTALEVAQATAGPDVFHLQNKSKI